MPDFTFYELCLLKSILSRQVDELEGLVTSGGLASPTRPSNMTFLIDCQKTLAKVKAMLERRKTKPRLN